MRRIAFALLGLLLCFTTHAAIAPGDMPSDALRSTQKGQLVTVSSLHGKVVVISFWATWCGYCMKEMPVLINLQALARRRHLPLQVVSIDDKESRNTFVSASRVLRPKLPNLLITWDRDGDMGKPYGVKGIPVMVMLHRDGSVAHVHIGYGENMPDTLVAEINDLLDNPATPTPAVAANRSRWTNEPRSRFTQTTHKSILPLRRPTGSLRVLTA